MAPKVIYEDKDFVAVSKPAGMLVHKTRTNADNGRISADDKARINADVVRENLRSYPRASATLVDWLLKRYPEVRNIGDDPAMRPGIVHRLDKETSGVMIIPRNQKFFEYIKSLFKERKIRKTYLAVVFRTPKEKKGRIEKAIGIKNGSVKRSVHSEKMIKSAVTEYEVKKTFTRDGNEFSLLEVRPLTGRTHQIRVHLASIGHPVVGDDLYGRRKENHFAKRLMLHAYSLEFSLPDKAGLAQGARVKLEAEPESDFTL